MNSQISSLLVLALLCCLNSPRASGQDFYGTGVTADTGRRAGVYIPSSENPTDALALNPAGLSAVTAPTINLSLTGVFARGSFSNASNNASPMASNHGFVPFGSFGAPIGKRWTIGLGVMPDLLSASRWNYADTPGFAGTTYGAQSEKSQIVAIRSAAGIAYRFSDRLCAGATVGVDYNSNTLDAPYIFQSFKPLARLKTLLNLHTTGYGWNSSFGFTAKPSKRLDVGFSFGLPHPLPAMAARRGILARSFRRWV
jgi:long-subunit fatty acid transport protein